MGVAAVDPTGAGDAFTASLAVFWAEGWSLREAARLHPADVEAQRSLGTYLLKQGQPYEAMWAYQDALELRPGDAEARRGLARALIIAQLPRRELEVGLHGVHLVPLRWPAETVDPRFVPRRARGLALIACETAFAQ